jgi:hypothetical protein
VTTVKKNVSDVTVIIELATASNTVRAASASPPKTTALNHGGSCWSTRESRSGIITPNTAARVTPRIGMGHSFVLSASRTVRAAVRTESCINDPAGWARARVRVSAGRRIEPSEAVSRSS